MFRITDTGLDRVVTIRELRSLFRTHECWRSYCHQPALSTSISCEEHDQLERESTSADRDRGLV